MSSLPMARRTPRPYGERVRFLISIHQFDSTGFDATGLRAYLKRAEELGFEGGWVLEQTVGPAPLLAPLTLRGGATTFVPFRLSLIELGSAIDHDDRSFP